MTDQTIPADLHPEDVEHARSYVQDFLDATYAPDRTLAVARVLHALLPPPPRPTLADMTGEERAECQWMQCEVRGERRIITLVFNNGHEDLAATLDSSGHTIHCPLERVTPRPDLPRMEWPSDKKPDTSATVPESTLAVGSVWDDINALTDACEESGRDQIVVLDRTGDAYVWGGEAEWWEFSTPFRFGPFTIIHAGRKADQ